MIKRFKQKFKENNKIFVLYKSIKNINDPKLYTLLRSYYQAEYEGCIYMV